jgi:hypothetical protein
MHLRLWLVWAAVCERSPTVSGAVWAAFEDLALKKVVEVGVDKKRRDGPRTGVLFYLLSWRDAGQPSQPVGFRVCFLLWSRRSHRECG